MADVNEIRISSSVTGVAVLDDSIGGIALEAKVVDQNVGSTGGGYNDISYDGDAAVKYVGVLVATASAAGAVGTATTFIEAGHTKTGTDPVKANCFAVSYDSELGTVGDVTVQVGSQIHAELSVGEGVVIPISGAADVGLAIANCIAFADVYADGVNEASVSIAMIGQNA